MKKDKRKTHSEPFRLGNFKTWCGKDRRNVLMAGGTEDEETCLICLAMRLEAENEEEARDKATMTDYEVRESYRG